jgi:hypothetical protein
MAVTQTSKSFLLTSWFQIIIKNIINFITNNATQHTLSIGYNKTHLEGYGNMKFLDLQIDNHLNWKNCINHSVHKISGAY